MTKLLHCNEYSLHHHRTRFTPTTHNMFLDRLAHNKIFPGMAAALRNSNYISTSYSANPERSRRTVVPIPEISGHTYKQVYFHPFTECDHLFICAIKILVFFCVTKQMLCHNNHIARLATSILTRLNIYHLLDHHTTVKMIPFLLLTVFIHSTVSRFNIGLFG